MPVDYKDQHCGPVLGRADLNCPAQGRNDADRPEQLLRGEDPATLGAADAYEQRLGDPQRSTPSTTTRCAQLVGSAVGDDDAPDIARERFRRLRSPSRPCEGWGHRLHRRA